MSKFVKSSNLLIIDPYCFYLYAICLSYLSCNTLPQNLTEQLKTTNIYYFTWFQWYSGMVQAQLWSSEGSTGEWSSSKLPHMVDGRPQILAESSGPCHMGLSRDGSSVLPQDDCFPTASDSREKECECLHRCKPQSL